MKRIKNQYRLFKIGGIFKELTISKNMGDLKENEIDRIIEEGGEVLLKNTEGVEMWEDSKESEGVEEDSKVINLGEGEEDIVVKNTKIKKDGKKA